MLDIKSEIQAQWPQIVEQVKENTRLRVCLWAIAFIIISYPLFLMADYNNELKADLNNSLEREAKILRTVSEKEWFERAEQSKSIEQDIEGQIGQADSLGTAKAATFQILRDWVSQTKASDVQIKLEDPVLVDEVNNIYRISGQINAPFELQSSFALLEKIESNKQKFVVERMEISQTTRPVFKLVIATYLTVNNQ